MGCCRGASQGGSRGPESDEFRQICGPGSELQQDCRLPVPEAAGLDDHAGSGNVAGQLSLGPDAKAHPRVLDQTMAMH